jgi:hypothetical protein
MDTADGTDIYRILYLVNILHVQEYQLVINGGCSKYYIV